MVIKKNKLIKINEKFKYRHIVPWEYWFYFVIAFIIFWYKAK